jgi:hypothetical protein
LTVRTFLVAPPSCLYSLCLYGPVVTPAEGACHGWTVVENKQTTTSVLIKVTAALRPTVAAIMPSSSHRGLAMVRIFIHSA